MENLIILTSVLITSPEPLPWSVRSVFNPQKRLEQTAYSILSIKKYAPTYFLVFVEGSKIPIEWENFIKSKVDYYLNIADTDYSKYINGQSKGLGEISLLLSYLKSSHFQSNKNNVKSIYKMTGRYIFNQNHIFNSQVNNIVFKIFIITQKREQDSQISTIYYSMPIAEIDNFINILEESYKDDKFVLGVYPIECYLYDKWIKDRKNVYSPFILGIQGFSATFGDLIKY